MAFFNALIIVVVILCNVISANALFNGQPFTGSADQLAELDRITTKAQAERAKVAEKILEGLQKPIDVTPSLNKHANVSKAQVDEARRVVDEARKKWVESYRHYVNSPRRNIYKSAPPSKGQRVVRSNSDLLAVDETIAAAASLVAEVDAAAQYRNGTLYQDYSKILEGGNKAINSSQDPPSMDKRADKSYWLGLLGPKDHGSAPFSDYNDYNASICSSYDKLFCLLLAQVFRNVKFYGAVGDGIHVRINLSKDHVSIWLINLG